MTTLPAPAAASRVSSKDVWLVSPFYDLVFIIFSSVLLVVPHLFSQLGGFSNVIVTSSSPPSSADRTCSPPTP